MPFERYCDWNEIMDLVHMGCELGWHTWTHPDLTLVSEAQLVREIQPPFPMTSFAYPYGKLNEKVIEAVKKQGFKNAYAVHSGDNTDFQLLRGYMPHERGS
jgi:peptidoglycan/xylan/chitin deacetylase (PgdA/CDA1 family)